jgi:hypothetical protein
VARVALRDQESFFPLDALPEFVDPLDREQLLRLPDPDPFGQLPEADFLQARCVGARLVFRAAGR